MIFGGNHFALMDINKEAYLKLNCEKEIQTIAGAGHLFEEPNKLDKVATLDSRWFQKYLVQKSAVQK